MFIARETPQIGLKTWIKQTWFLLVLGTLLLGLASFSVMEAKWVLDSTPLVWCMIGGVISGGILASSRFKGGPAFVYNLIFAVFIVVQAVERFIPGWEDLMRGDWILVMNVRFQVLVNRFGEWLALFRNGKDIEDTRLFIFLIGIVLWHACAWMSWCMLRRHDAWLGSLPFGFLLGMNIYLSGQSLWRWVLFCTFILIIAGFTAYRGKHTSWNRRKLDYPEGLGYEWLLLVTGFVIPLVIIARLIVFLGTPEGWQAISDLFPKPQQSTDELASQLFSQVKPPSPTQLPDALSSIQIETPNLNNLGDAISSSPQVVMWVSVSDILVPPQLSYLPVQIDLNLPRHYWRSGIYAEYTGTGWKPAAEDEAPGGEVADGEAPGGEAPDGEASGLADLAPGKFVLVQSYQLAVSHAGDLFSVNNPVIATEGISLSQFVPGDSATVKGEISSYQVTSLANRVTRQQLEGAGETYPEEVRRWYLQLPASLPGRVHDLAAHVTAGARTPFDKAVLIQDYLRSNYEYLDSVPRNSMQGDVVDYFLFDAPGGFCSYYASAMAVMLRSTGVPARVVSGYSMGTYDPSQNLFIVRMLDAHAWVEVYFPGIGWVEFEPTVSQQPFDYPSVLPATESSATGILIEEDQPGWSSSTYLWCLRVLLLLGVILFVVWYWRRREWRGVDRTQQACRLYGRVRKGLGWIGLAAPSSVTPDEYLTGYEQQLNEMAWVGEAVRLITGIYLTAVYSRRIPYYSDIQIAESAIQRAIPEFLWMLLKTFIRGRKQPEWTWQDSGETNI